MVRWLGAALTILAVAGLAGVQYGRSLLEPVSNDGTVILFQVEDGASFSTVAARLETEGLIQSARLANLLARTQGIDQKLHVGEYELSANLSTEDVLKAITGGPVKTWTVTIPEGSRAVDIATRLEAAGLTNATEFLLAVDRPTLAEELGVPADGLEGYLYPDTYRLPRGLSPERIARIMVKQFDRVWTTEIAELASTSTLSKNQIVILASIVEK